MSSKIKVPKRGSIRSSVAAKKASKSPAAFVGSGLHDVAQESTHDDSVHESAQDDSVHESVQESMQESVQESVQETSQDRDDGTDEADEPKAAQASSSSGPRRGPGRPTTRPKAPLLPREGVGSAPQDPGNRLELVYESPMMFRELFSYFKNRKSRLLHVRCQPDSMTIFSRDHSMTSRDMARINGCDLNWFYCEGEIWFGLNRELVEGLFSSISKTIYKITIIQTKADPSSITIIYKDTDSGKEMHYFVSTTALSPDEELYELERLCTPESLARYPIEFTLGALQFKQSMSTIGKYSETFAIEKQGSQPLQFVHTSGVAYHEVYRDPDRIFLRADNGDRTFRVEVAVKGLSAMSSAVIADQITVYCCEGRDLVFRSHVEDKALELFSS